MTTTDGETAQAARNRNISILVVDDEQGILDLLSYELGLHGYTVEKAYNGEEGIEKIKRHRFNLVISDVKMPKIGGIEVLEVIKDIDPAVEVIMTTGFGTIDMAVECIKKGAYDFISKPYNLDELLSKVEKALEKQRLSSELLSLKEIHRMKTVFLSSTSHELRTPAAAIQNYASLMLDKVYGEFTQEQELAVKCIKVNADTILRLVNTIAHVSRLADGKVVLYWEEFGVAALFAEILKTLAPFSAKKKAVLSTAKTGDVRLVCDRAHLKQILITLASTVLQLAPGAAIGFSARTADGRVFIELTITAGTLPPELAAPAGWPAMSESLKGIADARQLAELLTASVAMECKGGNELVFTVSLAAGHPPSAENDPACSSVYPSSGAHRRTLLVIDDDPAVHQRVRELAKDTDCAFAGALNIDDGILLARQLKPAALLLDLLMSRKDGWQALELLKNDADLKAIPVITLSAQDNAAVALTLGAAAHLSKPFENEDLIHHLKALRILG